MKAPISLNAVGSNVFAGKAKLLTVPNTLGVDYNIHVLSAILEQVAPALGWR